MVGLKVTVVIPVYNGASFIDHALQSVLAQTQRADEIVVVNDGSTDDSAEAIATAVNRVSGVDIVVISQENGGQSCARNTAVARASGDLIAFLDQDDSWHPEHLAVLTEGFESDPTLGWVYSDFDEMDANGLLVTRGYLAVTDSPQPKSSVVDYIIRDAMILPTASVIRAAALNAVGGFDERLSGYEDDDLFLRLFRAGWQCRFEPRSLVQFRVHALSSSARSSFGRSREIFFEKVCLELPDDARLNRYYVSEILLPRMLTAVLRDYLLAIVTRNDSDARSIAQSARRMCSKSRVTAKRGIGLAIIRHPGLCRFVLRLHARLPRKLRPRLNPAFRRD
jgi:glycosyltransferase involved in cell wall biosynthesis